MFVELLHSYYFPTMGLIDYPRKQDFICGMDTAISSGTQFEPIVSEYNRLRTYVLNKLELNPSDRANLQTFNRMRFHIQIELQKFSDSPVFEHCNI